MCGYQPRKGVEAVKDVREWITVHELYRKGVSIREISRQLKMSRNTVRRLLRSREQPKYSREHYQTIIDDYKDLIEQWYLNPEYNYIGTRIYRELIKLGYAGSKGPIYRYLATLKEEKKEALKKATVRFETPPGDQAQFDWSPYKVRINGEIQDVYCFAMILASSRYKAIVFSKKSDADSIYEAIQELFAELGGITSELLIDNPKGLVDKHIIGEEPVYNLQALRVALHLGTELNACAPYRARTKGKIERPFNYIEEQFLKGNSFQSMTDLNERAKAFITDWCNQSHTTTQRIPAQAVIEERKTLLPLPSTIIYIKSHEKRKVSLDCLISVNGKKYSVPAKYVNKNVLIRVSYGYLLKIFDTSGKLIYI